MLAHAFAHKLVQWHAGLSKISRSLITLIATTASDFQYAGMYEHGNSGLNLTLFRAYNPVTAKWLSRDPIGETAGLNIYAYCANNSLRFCDPLGASLITAGIGGGTGAATGAVFGAGAGAVTGAAAGAVLGTFLGPLGTVAGAEAGAWAGGIAGGLLGSIEGNGADSTGEAFEAGVEAGNETGLAAGIGAGLGPLGQLYWC